MARYIDADVLKEELKLLTVFVTGMLCGKTHLTEVVTEYKKSLFKLIDEQPDADVVPRSEVARELNAFAGKVGRIYNHYVFEDTDYAEDDVAIEAVINALTEVLNDLSDLCQKYTEGEK